MKNLATKAATSFYIFYMVAEDAGSKLFSKGSKSESLYEILFILPGNIQLRIAHFESVSLAVQSLQKRKQLLDLKAY